MLKYRNSILLVLFSAGFVKLSLFSPTLSEALVLLIVGMVYSYLEYKNQDVKMAEFEQRLNEKDRQYHELNEKVGSIKIIQQVKPGNMGFRS